MKTNPHWESLSSPETTEDGHEVYTFPLPVPVWILSEPADPEGPGS